MTKTDITISPPQIIETKARHTAVIHLTIPRSEMMHVFGPATQELVAELTAQGMPPAGSAFAHHLQMSPGTFDFELGFITASPVAVSGRVKPGHWPKQKAAHTVYAGSYEGLPAAWEAFVTWMKANDVVQAQDLWEHYVVGPHSSPNPADWRTELYRPLMA
ncbi:GyrI-like domain-containing protein [Roseiarcaceae bacterium H3SJ34-1]|uniref:GyrI-like domain-containing protein n=1 Tax=Terripilifer ovatus TaxID=3032367 RepID=UPI003AB95157|nr:GyrI-like domain-containing protein [Roseiarcaceae bacterium H3SJ34-1]